LSVYAVIIKRLTMISEPAFVKKELLRMKMDNVRNAWNNVAHVIMRKSVHFVRI